MKRNMFGDPQPKGTDEINEAMGERDVNNPWAQITNDRESAPPFQGWSAEIFGEDSDGEDLGEAINTLGYQTKEELLADLKAVGITNIIAA